MHWQHATHVQNSKKINTYTHQLTHVGCNVETYHFHFFRSFYNIKLWILPLRTVTALSDNLRVLHDLFIPELKLFLNVLLKFPFRLGAKTFLCYTSVTRVRNTTFRYWCTGKRNIMAITACIKLRTVTLKLPDVTDWRFTDAPRPSVRGLT